jgi:vacuolar iron transporter family protein
MDRDAGASHHHHHHEHRSVSGGLARASVFGVSDGLVSNISLVSGVFSMAAGEYVSVAAQNDLIERELAVERRELRRNPEAETAELTRLYVMKGVEHSRAEAVASDIMRDPETALGVHALEELGVDPDDLASPWRTALASFLAFTLGAVLPVVPWFIGSGVGAAVASVVIGIVAAAIVGTSIGRLSERRVARSAMRQVAILLLACGATYGVGAALGVTVT